MYVINVLNIARFYMYCTYIHDDGDDVDHGDDDDAVLDLNVLTY